MQDCCYDVAVIGAGPQGLMAASWIKRGRPALRVVVIDSQEWAGHKIGESTLSGFCRAVRSVDVRHEVLQRLFYPKNGLGFFWTDSATTDLGAAPEYITETFDETFQVERRVLDSLLEANAQRLGVEILRGAQVVPKESEFSVDGHKVVHRVGDERRTLEARIVLDASGPASVLGKHFGGYAPARVPFQTSSVWAYFKNVEWLANYEKWSCASEYPRDQYTQHLCFKEGWLWYIPIVSWESSSHGNLRRMLRYLADPKSPIQTRDELSARFDCPYEQVWSIGISLRSDRDEVLKRGPREVFEHYSREIPAIGTMLVDAEILDGHYKAHKPYSMRMKYRRYAKQVAGDGWLLIGDAAFFVDPLRSPGLTGGMATTYYAVQEVFRALDQGNTARSQFARYEKFVRELYEILEEQNQIAYMSHNHPEAISIVRRFGEVSSRGHFNSITDQPYTLADTNVWGHLWPEHRGRQRQVWQIMREEEVEVGHRIPLAQQTPKDYERMIQRLQEAVGDHLERHVELTPYVTRNPQAHRRLTKVQLPPVGWMHPAAEAADVDDNGQGDDPDLGWHVGVFDEAGVGNPPEMVSLR